MMTLDIIQLESGFINIKIGELTKNTINLLKLNREKCDIIMWEDRFKYIEKHIEDFNTKEDFDLCMSYIPEIIANPDYIAKHPSKNSLEYIKQVNELMIVVVRIKDKGNLAFRTAYPLSKEQLEDYINSGTAIKMR
jgi:predicted RNA methylase